MGNEPYKNNPAKTSFIPTISFLNFVFVYCIIIIINSMGELKAKDSRIFDYPVDYVYRVLTDIASYHKWWPREISFELEYLDPGVIGTVVNVHNGLFVSWKAKVSGFRTNRLLAIDYTEGSWIGKTYWRFEDKAGKTEISLEIDLSVNRAWLDTASKFVDFSHIHSRQMQKVFNNLDKYLRENEQKLKAV